jgi:IS30 family transposase
MQKKKRKTAMKKKAKTQYKTVAEYLKANVGKYPNRGDLARACSKDMNVHLSTPYKKINHGALDGLAFSTGELVPSYKSDERKKTKTSRKKKGVDRALNLDDIKEELDIPSQVRSIITGLGEKVLKDQDLRVSVGVDKDKWSEILALKSLSKYHILLEGRKNYIIWGDPSTLQKLKTQLELI